LVWTTGPLSVDGSNGGVVAAGSEGVVAGVAGVDAVGVEVLAGVCVLQSHDQFHAQLHAHACCRLHEYVEPSLSVQFQFHVQRPVSPAVVDEFATPLEPGLFDQIQLHIEPSVEVVFGSPPSAGGVHVPSQIQFHCQSLPVGRVGSVGSDTATAMFVPGVTVTMP
jgi:hypothetical protein